MNENNNDCGWVKIWHKRGVLVTVPLRGEASTFSQQIDALFDQGFLAQAPGLEEGEEKEQIGWVLRSVHSNEGRETPFVLLYSANEALTWSILKIYLNTDQDQAAFEFASKMRLSDLPEYVGQDKPQRSASGRTDKYIVPAPKPFGVVFRKNPKHDATEAGKMKPARLFVRWADVAPAAEVGTGTISVKQQDELDAMLPAAGYGTDAALTRLLDWISKVQGGEIRNFAEIQTATYPKVVELLQKNAARKGGAA